MTLSDLQFWEWGWFKAFWNVLTSLVTGNAKILKGQEEIKQQLSDLTAIVKQGQADQAVIDRLTKDVRAKTEALARSEKSAGG